MDDDLGGLYGDKLTLELVDICVIDMISILTVLGHDNIF